MVSAGPSAWRDPPLLTLGRAGFLRFACGWGISREEVTRPHSLVHLDA